MTSIGEYSSTVLSHFRNPKNVGEIPDADGYAVVGSPSCGDLDSVYIKVDPHTKIITDIKFQAFGCAANISAMSMLTELVKGRTVEGAQKLTKADIVEALDGLPPTKVHCSVLADEALFAAIQDYFNRQKK